MSQQIIWTALPNGLKLEGSGQKLRLSVFVSPRLRFDDGRTTGDLDAFPNFLDWPAKLRSGSVTFKVVVDDGANPVPPFDSAVVTNPAPDSSLWTALFRKTTLVRSHEFEGVPPQPIGSYPASQLASHVSDGYQTLGAKSPYTVPDRNDLKNAFPELHRAIAPDQSRSTPAVFNRLRDVETIAENSLVRFRHDLSADFLRHDADTSFADRLVAAIASAGRLARSPETRRAVPIIPKMNGPANAFAQFAAFHRRLPEALHSDRAARGRDVPNDVRNIDFHRMLSALGEYPDLLRRLGLIIDLEISDANFPSSFFGNLKRLRVEPAPRSTDNYSPATVYIYDVRPTGSSFPFPLFSAAPRRAADPPGVDPIRDSEIIGGLLNLRIPKTDDPQAIQFDVIQFDVDGAAAKLLNALNSVVHAEQNPNQQPIDESNAAPAPAFRTSGLSLVRANQADVLHSELTKAAEHEDTLHRPAERVEFFAEDLLRGYRFDIRRFPADYSFDGATSPPPPWISLHKRNGSFAVHRAGMSDIILPSLPEEGFLQPSIAQHDTSDPHASGVVSPLYVVESLCHWQGWGLSASPPTDPVELARSTPDTPPADASPLSLVEVNFEAKPSSLPRLRYGHYYQFRARTVDLAGNGLSVEEANNVLAALDINHRHSLVLPLRPQEELRYLRFEPIPAPALVSRSRFREGEAIDVLVIRSNGSTTAAYAASLGDSKYKAVNDRHIVPPKASQMMVEIHGLLDGALGPAGDPLKFYNICTRSSGTLNDLARQST
jgi:hypothetical protein